MVDKENKENKEEKIKYGFKSYVLEHKANPVKQDILFNLYYQYSVEFQILIKLYWKDFTLNNIKNNQFSHLGSTKFIQTQLNASYLQTCLFQVCSLLNNYLSNIEEKFNIIINQSSIKDKNLLHQLRTINSTHAWFNSYYDGNYPCYYPKHTYEITDNFGNLITLNKSIATPIEKSTCRLAKKILFKILGKDIYHGNVDDYLKHQIKFSQLVINNQLNNTKNIDDINHKPKHQGLVRFPNINKPKLLLDSRLYKLEKSQSKTKNKNNKNNIKTKNNPFDYWLSISSLEKGQRISIPIQTNEYFEQGHGELGKTIELSFKYYDYFKNIHHHQSLNKRSFKLNNTNNINNNFNHKNKGKINQCNKNKLRFKKVNREIIFTFNKKTNLNEIINNINYDNLTKNISFDLGLCNLIASSDGQLYGQYWLDKLQVYDKQLTSLLADRQYCFRKQIQRKEKVNLRSKRYDSLVSRVRGFIKTEINRILNKYFDKNINIQTVIIEQLKFSSPNLSKKLNRIIQNFGLRIFKSKLKDLSIIKGFKIEELNPAYTSQECNHCGYIDENNRKTQSLFKCLCCKKELNADIQGARVNLKRFENKTNSGSKVLYKSIILEKLKLNFIKGIENLLLHGIVGRRELYKILNKNKYFKQDLKILANKKTTEVQGVEPMIEYELYLKFNRKV